MNLVLTASASLIWVGFWKSIFSGSNHSLKIVSIFETNILSLLTVSANSDIILCAFFVN